MFLTIFLFYDKLFFIIDENTQIFIFILIIIIVTDILLCSGFIRKEMNFIKDESTNLLEIKVMNFLGCSLQTEKLILENIHFDCKILEIENNRPTLADNRPSLNLYMINHFKNIEQIDLDWNVDNNTTKAVKIIYLFGNVKNIYYINTLKNKLNIVNSPVDYENTFFKNDEVENFPFANFKVQQLFKINENFFTLYLSFPFSMGFCKFFIISISLGFIFFNLIFYFLVKIMNEVKKALNISLIIILSMLFLLIISFILVKKSITRVDIFFSNSLDKIFIGFAYQEGTKYKKVIIKNIKDIKEFQLDVKNNNNYTFKIIMKNDDTINLGVIKRQLFDSNFHNLVGLLNEKLNN